MANKIIQKGRLYAQGWKLDEVIENLEEGRLSRTNGPIEVVHIEHGKYLIINGHHRALEHEGATIEAVTHNHLFGPALWEMFCNSRKVTSVKDINIQRPLP